MHEDVNNTQSNIHVSMSYSPMILQVIILLLKIPKDYTALLWQKEASDKSFKSEKVMF